MIDTQPVEHPVLDQPQHPVMYVLEHFHHFGTQSGQIVDVEEATVVDVVGCDPKVRHAPVLLLDQGVQFAPAGAVARAAFEAAQRELHCLAHRGTLGHQRRQLQFEFRGA